MALVAQTGSFMLFAPLRSIGADSASAGGTDCEGPALGGGHPRAGDRPIDFKKGHYAHERYSRSCGALTLCGAVVSFCSTGLCLDGTSVLAGLSSPLRALPDMKPEELTAVNALGAAMVCHVDHGTAIGGFYGIWVEACACGGYWELFALGVVSANRGATHA